MVMMWSTSSEGSIWRLSLELQWIHVNTNEKQFSPLQFISYFLPVSVHKSLGCWRSQSTTSGIAFLLLSATPELQFGKGWVWISPWFSDSWLVLLSASGHVLQNHPSITFMTGWLQTRGLWLHLMLLTIANADCFGGSFRPVCSWGRSVLPGVLLQLACDKTDLKLFSFILDSCVGLKHFRTSNIKARERELERIIKCWCSLWECASCPQQN